MTDLSNPRTDQLVADLKAVAADAEQLLKATADQTGEQVAQARRRLTDSLADARKRVIELEALVVERTKVAAKATDRYVNENPWKSVGVAAGVGFLLGLLSNRR